MSGKIIKIWKMKMKVGLCGHSYHIDIGPDDSDTARPAMKMIQSST